MTWPVKYQSPLLFDGWLEFNRYKWGVTPLKLRVSEEEKTHPAIESVLYLDKKGRIVQPPLNPYIPVAFYPTPSGKITRLYRQWLQTSKLLVEEFLERGVKGSVAFCPEVVDVRQWKWHGFIVDVRYTFYIQLPYDIEFCDHSVLQKIKKAEKASFTCDVAKTSMFSEVLDCLAETESRQKFSYALDVKDLEMASDLLGENVFRVYVCKSKNGKVASCRIVLSIPGTRAVDWVAGTRKDFLSSGATQLLIWHVLKDLRQQGATGFDFVGANLPTVSSSKADWRGTLTPYYVIRPLNVRTLAALGWTMISSWRKSA